jgi:hypothetical protein
VLGCGESQKEAIRPDFNRAIMIDFHGATISSHTRFILLREVDERFKIFDPIKDCFEDLRSPAHTKHAMVQMVQRVYQIAAGYEDCNDADFLRIDPALRLALGSLNFTAVRYRGAEGQLCQNFQKNPDLLLFG